MLRLKNFFRKDRDKENSKNSGSDTNPSDDNSPLRLQSRELPTPPSTRSAHLCPVHATTATHRDSQRRPHSGPTPTRSVDGRRRVAHNRCDEDGMSDNWGDSLSGGLRCPLCRTCSVAVRDSDRSRHQRGGQQRNISSSRSASSSTSQSRFTLCSFSFVKYYQSITIGIYTD